MKIRNTNFNPSASGYTINNGIFKHRIKCFYIAGEVVVEEGGEMRNTTFIPSASGYRINNTIFNTVTTRSRMHCTVTCLQINDCAAFNYDADSKACELIELTSQEYDVIESDVNWTYHEREFSTRLILNC